MVGEIRTLIERCSLFATTVSYGRKIFMKSDTVAGTIKLFTAVIYGLP
jgi:hypothetical protein